MNPKLGAILKDTRTNRVCMVEAIKDKNLYTIKYMDGSYRRYYSDRLNNHFKPYRSNKDLKDAVRMFIGDMVGVVDPKEV